MGVYTTNYVVLGCQIPTGVVSDNYEKMEPYLEGRKENLVNIIYDGMNDEYAVVGKVLVDVDEGDSDSVYPIDIEDIGEETRQKINEEINDIVGYANRYGQELKLYYICHRH